MEYNKIIVTNFPAFYKVNLFNAMNKKIKILVIFVGNRSAKRDGNFYKNNLEFEYLDLNGVSKINKIASILSVLKNCKYDELIIGAWESILYFISSFISPRSKNSMILESSYHESKTTGVKALIKKIFLKNISKAYVSGFSQKEILVRLKFRGDIIVTKGVGVFNYIEQPPFKERNSVNKFIYVGRLSPEKNLVALINVFNEIPEFTLNLIGYGPQEEYLKSIANDNIYFHGSVKNTLLPSYFSRNDVLILPSVSEAWGLVVEEAFNNGLPVIVSNRVGCAEEIVENFKNGLIFDIEKEDDLLRCVKQITDVSLYNKMRYNISEMDFEKNTSAHIDIFSN